MVFLSPTPNHRRPPHPPPFPSPIAGVAPVLNTPGMEAGKLRFSGAVLADIYLGKITTWNDARIAAVIRQFGCPRFTATLAVHGRAVLAGEISR